MSQTLNIPKWPWLTIVIINAMVRVNVKLIQLSLWWTCNEMRQYGVEITMQKNQVIYCFLVPRWCIGFNWYTRIISLAVTASPQMSSLYRFAYSCQQYELAAKNTEDPQSQQTSRYSYTDINAQKSKPNFGQFCFHRDIG